MVAFVPTIPYADTTFGDAYFGERLRTEAWDAASNLDKIKALKQATTAIDNLNFAGHKADESQPNQFPRGGDTVVPDAVAKACCELALAFLDDVDPNLEIEGQGIGRLGIGDAHTLRDTSYVQEHARAGIPSIQAWTLLLPFLRDTQHPRIELHRGG